MTKAESIVANMKKQPSFNFIETWIFDLDNTLYPARCNLFAAIDRRMTEYISTLLAVDLIEAKRLQKQYFLQHGTTLRGLMSEHGIDPRSFLDYVHDIDLTPVPPSRALDAALHKLPGRKVIFTNGSVAHAERVIGRLGIAHHFEHVFDIVASDYRPKPDPAPYRQLCTAQKIDPRAAVMVEDMARNLVPAHDLGMTTVWVPSGSESSREGADRGHVHHVVEDLESWLADLVAGPG